MTPITIEATLRRIEDRAIVPGETVPVVIEAAEHRFVATIGSAKGTPAHSISAALRNAIAVEGHHRPNAYWGSQETNELSARAYAALERRFLDMN